jgi:hypothetical protein
MIARGLVLLGFRPSGMRTGQESLEEEGHTSTLWSDESAGNYGSREAHTISSSTSCPRRLVHYC